MAGPGAKQMKQAVLMVANNAVAAAYPPPLVEVERPPVAVVTAVGIVGCGRPVTMWMVSAFCPFGCDERIHAFGEPVKYPLGETVEYCASTGAFYNVIIPDSLLIAAAEWVSSERVES